MNAPVTADQANARATVAAMTALVDVRDWERLERCFADDFTIDYTSLWGGEPQHISRAALIEQWQALLPGFDATQHELGPITIHVAGDEATAEATRRRRRRPCPAHTFWTTTPGSLPGGIGATSRTTDEGRMERWEASSTGTSNSRIRSFPPL